jgi:hypothetical protein
VTLGREANGRRRCRGSSGLSKRRRRRPGVIRGSGQPLGQVVSGHRRRVPPIRQRDGDSCGRSARGIGKNEQGRQPAFGAENGKGKAGAQYHDEDYG